MVAYHTPPTGNLDCNPGMYPDWESSQQPFGFQASTQSTELSLVFKKFLPPARAFFNFFNFFILFYFYLKEREREIDFVVPLIHVFIG